MFKSKKEKIKNSNSNNKKKIIIFVVAIIIFISIIVGFYFLYININGESKYLKISLNGDNKITLEYGNEYNDLGATAFYKDKNITKNVKITNNLDLKKLGNYKYVYTINYKKQTKKIIRKVNVIDSVKPEIVLNGNKDMTLYIGDTYKEEFAKANDNYDGDISEKIIITGNVDTGKVGEYTIVYNVSDSSGNESIIERKVNIVEKPVVEQKVAVLNYHFFYEDWDSEPCHEVICEKMDTFRKQLQYLKDNNFKTLTMKEFVDWMYGRIEIPKKSVLITIDDGAYGTGKHNGNHLIPTLEKYQVNATLFLITGWWDIENYRSPYLEVESHTHDLHVGGNCSFGSKVNCVGYDALVADLKKSIDVTKSTNAFCFPFYEYSNESIRAVKDVGFQVAFIGGNRKASRKDDKYKIPRYPIHDSTSMEQFKNMVN